MVDSRIVSSKPALILEGQKKNLIITDLHIGFESNLAFNDIFVGKNTTIKETISGIRSIIEETKPDSLILLGDVKSSIKSISKNEWNDVPLFLESMQKLIDIILIPGNHDSNIERLTPDGVTLISSAGLVIENVLLTHGHTLPSKNFAHVDKIIMGHIHPVFFQKESILNGQRVWVSLKTPKQNIFPSEKGELEIIIVPSFNKYFYATNKHKYKKSISPIIGKIKEFQSAKIITLDGTIIGNELQIEQVL